MKCTPKMCQKAKRMIWYWLQCHWFKWRFKLATKMINVMSFHKVWLRIVLTATRRFLWKTSCSKVLTIGTFVQQIALRFTKFRCRYVFDYERKLVRLAVKIFSRLMATMKRDCGFARWDAVRTGIKSMRCF
jgi:hypothetical protein